MRRLAWLVALGTVLLGAGAALAQGWPTKPVRLIVAFAPGSATDIVGRVVAAKRAELWGQPVVVETRAGAGGLIGASAVAKAAPDGDTLEDFVNLAPPGSQPSVRVVGPLLGWKTVGDLLAAAMTEPGAPDCSPAGIGSGTHLSLEKFKLMAGVDVTHVPDKGRPEAIGDTRGFVRRQIEDSQHITRAAGIKPR